MTDHEVEILQQDKPSTDTDKGWLAFTIALALVAFIGAVMIEAAKSEGKNTTLASVIVLALVAFCLFSSIWRALLLLDGEE